MPDQNEPKAADASAPEPKAAESNEDIAALKARLEAAERELNNLRASTPGERLSAARVEPVEPPKHPFYEVLTDTWGYDSATSRARVKGDIIPAAEIGPHWKWAVNTGTVRGLTAKAAKSTDSDGDPGPSIELDDDVETVDAKVAAVMDRNRPDPDDDVATVTAKQLARANADVARTRAAEERQNRANLGR